MTSSVTLRMRLLARTDAQHSRQSCGNRDDDFEDHAPYRFVLLFHSYSVKKLVLNIELIFQTQMTQILIFFSAYLPNK